MKKFVSLILALLMLTSLLTGCGGETNSSGEQLTETTSDTLRVIIPSPPGTLDPIGIVSSATLYIDRTIFSTLVYISDTNTLENDLAEEWSVSDDGLLYTFKIKQGVTFHDGTPLTADDVVFSIQANVESPNTMGYYTAVASVDKVDDTTLTLTMNSPNGNIPYLLADVMIVPAAQYQELGSEAFAEVLNGSGPYVVDKMNTVEETYSVVRNENYYGELPQPKAITMRTIVETSTAAIALENNEADWALMNGTTAQTVEAANGLSVASNAGSNHVYLCFNTAAAPFDNATFRRAVAYALDYESIVAAYSSQEATANSSWNNSVWGKSVSTAGTLTYDPAKATELLAEAGIETPIDLGVMMSLPGTYSRAAQVMQQNLADVGITVSVETVDPSTWGMNLMTGNFTMTNVSENAYLDMAATLESAFKTGSSANYSKYSNPEVDALLEQIQSSTEAERDEYYEQLFTIIETECPLINLYDTNVLIGYKDGLVPYKTIQNAINFAKFKWGE